MSDEQPAAPSPRKSSFVSMLIWLGVAVMVAAIAAVVLYLFVLKPRLSEDGGARSSPAADAGDKLNPNAVTVDFDDAVASVKMPTDSQLPAAMLLFAVSLECNNQMTADLLEKHRARFTDMINKQHEFRTRAELDDPRVKADIQRTILMEANTILKQLQPAAINPQIQVTAVFHRRFLVSDQM
ncbi:MAG TPA: hypothetical protein PLM14_02495 [Candidatus Hydrogenedentes bacterium]|nr:hypothetical protein [Candidatus Hydrogenedentota bacterium]HQE81839.1 hypothetical protein [Candidatus Hydrogenedentota bacterium]HQH50869.1 hypothetical protein [Candidatus Hydrogenedentota bacterium]HQM48683.1 hypothetical protein [Candidatus Hydrogenedentota bacterium]